MLMFSFSKNKQNTVYELTRKQVKKQYRDSSLGFLWSVLNPLLNMLVMWFVFKTVLGINDPYYPIYLLTGNIMFTALRNATLQSLDSLPVNRGLILKTKIDLTVFPLSNVLSAIVNFFFSLIALIPFMIWLSISQGVNLFSYQLPFILLMVPAFVLFEYGLSLLLSCMFVFFRDIKHIYGVFITLWQYITPIFYTLNRVPQDSGALLAIKINPMFHFVNYFRDCVYRGIVGVNEYGQAVETFLPHFSSLGILYAIGIGMFIIGYIIFRPLKSKIVTRI